MRPRAIGIGLMSAAAVVACASSLPPGARYEKVPTRSLPSAGEALVVKPPSYATSPDRRYPVLYFLHDGYGDGKTLARRGIAARAAERMRDGSLPEFLIVAPEGSGSWFSDSVDGTRRFEEFLAGDLPRFIEEHYRVLPGKSARGVTGISMGGYGAVKLALKHPDMFGAASGLSAALIPIGPEDLERYNPVVRYTLTRVFGRPARMNSLAANDPWIILGGLCFAQPPFRVELRAGTEDVYGLDGVAAQYGSLLTEHGVPTTIVLEPGGHDWDYWRKAMLDILAWHGEQFEYDSRR